MDLGLARRTAIITGASRGIGLACARALAREGANVLMVARGEETLRASAAAIAASGGSVRTLVADVTRDEAAPAMVAAALESFGGVDTVVANAGGVVGPRDFQSQTSADWEASFRMNVLHATNLIAAAAPHLEKSGQGSAVFIASISGSAPQSPAVQYAAVKAAMIHAARSLAHELAPRRIRVNAVSPGSILFPGGNWERRQKTQPVEFAEFERREFPWGRLGTPEEVADVVAFLASPRASWINAFDLRVDGGQRKPSM